MTYTLFGTPFSYYTAKARAYLINKEIDFTEKLSTVRVYRKIIIPQTGRAMIPVVVTPEGNYLQDTALIIEALERRHAEYPTVPQTPRQKLVAYLIELFADEWLLLPAMHYRWNHHNSSFIYQEFGTVLAPTAPAFMRYLAGRWLSKRFRGYLPLLGIDSHTDKAIEAWYEGDLLPQLEAHFGCHAYVLGDAPCLADYSLMGPLYAHLYRDPAPGAIMKSHAPHVIAWIERMQRAPSPRGTFLPDDAIPETLNPIIKRQFTEQWPVLLATARAVAALGDSGATRVRRVLGQHEYTIGEAVGRRSLFSFAQWKMQRVLDCYEGLTMAERDGVNSWLQDVGGAQLMEFRPARRLNFDGRRLSFASVQEAEEAKSG